MCYESVFSGLDWPMQALKKTRAASSDKEFDWPENPHVPIKNMTINISMIKPLIIPSQTDTIPQCTSMKSWQKASSPSV